MTQTKNCFGCGNVFDYDPAAPAYFMSPATGSAFPKCPQCKAITPTRTTITDASGHVVPHMSVMTPAPAENTGKKSKATKG